MTISSPTTPEMFLESYVIDIELRERSKCWPSPNAMTMLRSWGTLLTATLSTATAYAMAAGFTVTGQSVALAGPTSDPGAASR